MWGGPKLNCLDCKIKAHLTNPVPLAKVSQIGRAVAGVGSAGIFSGALVIVAYTVPLDKR